ncbi:MAG: selenium cofactor biosynthesis protein YqeC [Anaerolineales bacterium]|nr:selenium cofactor biosynthesis protein YqeC [Anaerolineales bacterium]
MELSWALRVEAGQVIAFVGAGGKTSAIRRLVKELAGDMPVLITTSTKLALDEKDIADEHKIIEDAGGLLSALSDWDRDRTLLLTAPRIPDEPKWDGLPLAQLQDVIEFSREKKVVLLIEADGAAGRSLKAPAEHEPALPHNLDLLVSVVGIDAVGESVESDLVHRSDQLRSLLDVESGTELTVEHVASLLKHPSGSLKELPLHAVLRVLINKVTTKDRLKTARRIAELVLEEPKIKSVLIGVVQAKEPVREVRGRVAAIVLAAGESKRFKRNKLLQEWNGKPILQHVMDAARASKAHRRLLVVGHEHEKVLANVDHEGYEIVQNQDWKQGQSTSVQAGLGAVAGGVEAAVFPLGDMPRVDSGLIDELIDRHAETLAPVVAPQVEGEWGNPVLFDRVTFSAFSELTGDRGAKKLFSRYQIEAVPAGDDALQDIDYTDDLVDAGKS